MTREDIASAIAEKNESLTKKASLEIVDAVFGTIQGALQDGEEVRVHGFGTFKSKTRAARTARNPQTGEEVKVPEKTVAVFKPAKQLNDAL